MSLCRQDPDLSASAMEYTLAEVVRVSTDELEVVLRNQPPIGGLLTLEISRDSVSSAVVVKVTAAKSRSEGGWLVHCKPVLPLTRSLLQSAPAACAR
jgi:hypothetical protein